MGSVVVLSELQLRDTYRSGESDVWIDEPTEKGKNK